MADRPLQSELKVTLEPGTLLFREGDSTKDLYVVQSGKLRIFKTESGVEIDLAEIGAGGVVGEVAAIDGGRRSASGIAVEKTDVLLIPTEDFARVLEKVPDWFRKIATVLVQRLRNIDRKIHRSVSSDLTPHVAALINLMTYTPLCSLSADGPQISRKDLENELVDLLQIQLADISRALAELNSQGLIRLERKKVCVTSRARLEKLGQTVFAEPEPAPAT